MFTTFTTFTANQTDELNQGKVMDIWLVILMLILVTAGIVGGQVYWWQKSAAEFERKQLLLKIKQLQNEIRLLQQHSVIPGKPLKTNSQEPAYWKLLAGKSQQVILALQQNDLNTLASYIHPAKGVRLSPYVFVDPTNDLVFSANRMRSFFRDKAKRIWGYYEDTGMPIRLTNEAYFKSYIYDCNYALADKVCFNSEIRGSLTAGNVFEVYPNAIVIEYQFQETGNQDESATWRDLKLVFESKGKTWYLVGIIHDRWAL